jgi:hypothetical protein
MMIRFRLITTSPANARTAVSRSRLARLDTGLDDRVAALNRGAANAGLLLVKRGLVPGRNAWC